MIRFPFPVYVLLVCLASFTTTAIVLRIAQGYWLFSGT